MKVYLDESDFHFWELNRDWRITAVKENKDIKTYLSQCIETGKTKFFLIFINYILKKNQAEMKQKTLLKSNLNEYININTENIKKETVI